jgi:succinate dehydrogenase / fumarate reductase cytochrome b subunit
MDAHSGLAMTTGNRPLSPHLQTYRFLFIMVISMTHRLTGLALVVGTLLLTWWLVAAAAGPAAFDTVQAFIGTWFGRFILFGWTFSLFYHLCNGIRHLFWDAGYGYELPVVHASGWAVVAASTVLTLVSWIAGYAAM